MSQDNPPLPELLRTVREFIDEVTDKLKDQDRYHAMCASYLLAVAERELALGGEMDRVETAALISFTGQQQPLADSYAALAAAIRAGDCDARWEDTLSLLLRHVVNKVLVSRPAHLHPMHRTDLSPQEAE